MTDRPRVTSEAELRRLDGYTDSVDPISQPVKSVVTHYTIKPMIKCGLKSCRQPHYDGYVVSLVDGGVTNVGHVCGEQFGQRFVDERKKYTDTIIRPEAIKRLADAKMRFLKMQMELHGFRSQTNDLCEKVSNFKKQFPHASKEIERRAHNGDDRIFESVRRTNEEIETLLAANTGQKRGEFEFREELRGRIPGTKIFTTKLREMIVTNLVDRAEALRDTDLVALATDKLIELDRWAFDFNEAYETAKSILAAGDSFFTPSTFQLITLLPLPKVETIALKTLTVSSLIRATSPSSSTARPHPSTLSKKEADRQKKMDAILTRHGRR